MSYPYLSSRFVSFPTLSMLFHHKNDPSLLVGKVVSIRLGYFFIHGPILLLTVNSLSEMALIVGEYILPGSGVPIIILQRMTSFQNIKTVNNEEGPCSRWGHAMVTVQNTIYLFGGYQNSKYYNDLWRFDLATLAFERVPQQGELPPPCSNFTLTYHQQQNVLLLFGGGTLNKEKLNSIYKLDLSTLSWNKVGFDESSPQPWQRSYHCAEIIGHYLVITGGEYFHDLDDTWLFDLQANQWREIKLSEEALKPKARKFSSSFIYGNKLFVVGGCTGKYECVDDCFEMDFSEFLESGSMKSLSWKKVQFSNKDLLVRWGHISVVKGSKAYIFGGRLNNKDLQNLIEIDIPSYSCSAIEFKGPSPKGRRRPGICIKNSTLFCFSGFDGSYVKDFIYFSLPSSIDSNKISEEVEGKKELMRLLAPQNVEESCINFDDEVFYVAEEQFEEIQQYLCINESKKTFKLFKKLDYHINTDKITAKSAFFGSFLSSAYQPEPFELFCSERVSNDEKMIISKMLATYFQFGKIIVPQCEFFNSKMYFISLLDIAGYYCCEDLGEICRKELLKFFTDELVSPKAKIASIVGMCEVMAKINKQYENYAGYSLLKKLVEKNRGAISTMGDLRQVIQGEKELIHKEWMLEIADDHSFELCQLIMRKKEACLQNINSGNVPHKEEILYQKTRKGSMHSRHVNA